MVLSGDVEFDELHVVAGHKSLPSRRRYGMHTVCWDFILIQIKSWELGR
jgi:hypothetical protein